MQKYVPAFKLNIMVIPGSKENDDMVKAYMQGDDRCKYSIGDRVEKVGEQKGDHHMDGTGGIIIGNFYLIDNANKLPDMDTYFVHFDGDADHVLTFTTGPKLRLESKSE